MPQLIPFYFTNQLIFSFIALLTIIILFSKIILPNITLIQVIRKYISSL